MPLREISKPAEATAPPADDLPAAPAYPPQGKLVSALADHFGQGFDANFIDDPPEENPAWLQDGIDAARNAGLGANPGAGASRDLREGIASRYSEEYGDELNGEEDPFGDGFDRELARQFSGEAGLEGFEDEEHNARPISLRSLQWIRRNMSSLRIIVSLQRVTPPELTDEKPRKASGS